MTFKTLLPTENNDRLHNKSDQSNTSCNNKQLSVDTEFHVICLEFNY